MTGERKVVSKEITQNEEAKEEGHKAMHVFKFKGSPSSVRLGRCLMNRSNLEKG